MQRFSTKAVPPSAKLTYWLQIHRSQSHVLKLSHASNSDFEGECVSGTLGPLSVRRTASTPVRIEVTAEAAGAATTRRYFLLMPTSGSLQVRYGGGDCVLGAGDFVLLDTWTPSVVQIDAWNESITVGIPPNTLAQHLPEAEYVTGLPVSGSRGAGLLASSMLRSAATAVEQGLSPDVGLRLAGCLLEIVATSYSSEQVATSHGTGRRTLNRLRAKRIIEQHLNDPRLTPTFVADKLGVSARYLRMLFESEGEPMSRYILRRRLERCAEHLRYGASSDKTLTTIAFSYGFSSMAHFSRVFREHFDMTAGRYRAMHAQAAADRIVAAIAAGSAEHVGEAAERMPTLAISTSDAGRAASARLQDETRN